MTLSKRTYTKKAKSVEYYSFYIHLGLHLINSVHVAGFENQNPPNCCYSKKPTKIKKPHSEDEVKTDVCPQSSFIICKIYNFFLSLVNRILNTLYYYIP